MAASLDAAGIRVVGESSRWRPRPPSTGLDVLVFEAEHGGLQEAMAFGSGPSGSDVGLVALFRRSTDPAIADAVNAGVAAALSFSELTPELFVAAVRGVVTGTVTLSPEFVPRLLDQGQNGHGHAGGLTDRELQVLALMAEGESTRGIAGRLAFSERTVKNVVHDVLLKMDCRNRPHAVAEATRQGII
jgi:DNA-binding NarL/FixJ family response regulator